MEGSIEDLMPFNSEKMYEILSQNTIISGIGRSDFTIADFVADHETTTADRLVVEEKEIEQDKWL